MGNDGDMLVSWDFKGFFGNFRGFIGILNCVLGFIGILKNFEGFNGDLVI